MKRYASSMLRERGQREWGKRREERGKRRGRRGRRGRGERNR